MCSTVVSREQRLDPKSDCRTKNGTNLLNNRDDLDREAFFAKMYVLTAGANSAVTASELSFAPSRLLLCRLHKTLSTGFEAAPLPQLDPSKLRDRGSFSWLKHSLQMLSLGTQCGNRMHTYTRVEAETQWGAVSATDGFLSAISTYKMRKMDNLKGLNTN